MKNVGHVAIIRVVKIYLILQKIDLAYRPCPTYTWNLSKLRRAQCYCIPMKNVRHMAIITAAENIAHLAKDRFGIQALPNLHVEFI